LTNILTTEGIPSCVEQIGDVCNPNPVQTFLSVIRSDPIPVDLSKYLIQSGLYLKKTSDLAFTAVIHAVWISTSDPIEFFQNPVQPGSGSEVQNPLDCDPETGSCSTLIPSMSHHIEDGDNVAAF